ncbi:DUF1236 domain-containing protein [Rhizobium calliandrae]|uniref:DUF1236 domain-containing protein n=1 Tax=Rhizobium calliandrae TaxID=1312182 RepID=A0ABT7KGC0_9HYPH|nr:DUF1236 domain-containing protein [Rhizobium calliandrae]MDL2406234.1 DUF1236 domain-containing protein [Rhizobium calliandrae]
MKRTLLLASFALLTAGGAFAQSTVTVTPDNSITTGSTVVVPGEVTTYVTKQETPSVSYDGEIAVGTELPSSVEVHTIPSNSDYAYAIVNEKRVIVNPHTHKVIEIVK